MIRPILTICALALGGCIAQPPVSGPDAADPRASVRRCMAEASLPARLETLTRQVQVAPAQHDAGGRVIAPARYRRDTVQRIVAPRRTITMETPCPETLTPDFIASLQRTLAARGLYRGPASGRLTRDTRSAVRAFQRGFGPDTDILTLEAARRLGLVPLSQEQLNRLNAGALSPYRDDSPPPGAG